MSIRRQAKNTIVAEDERTQRTIIHTPFGLPPWVEVCRQTVPIDDAGETLEPRDVSPHVVRKASDIVDETVDVEVDGKTVMVSAALVMLALPLFFDRWAEEDRAKAAAEAHAAA